MALVGGSCLVYISLECVCFKVLRISYLFVSPPPKEGLTMWFMPKQTGCFWWWLPYTSGVSTHGFWSRDDGLWGWGVKGIQILCWLCPSAFLFFLDFVPSVTSLALVSGDSIMEARLMVRAQSLLDLAVSTPPPPPHVHHPHTTVPGLPW